MKWAGQLVGMADLGEMIFIPRSHGIFYLTSIKFMLCRWKKDYLDHVGFKGDFLCFQWGSQSGVAIQFCCINYILQLHGILYVWLVN